jgi:hypothetical protein
MSSASHVIGSCGRAPGIRRHSTGQRILRLDAIKHVTAQRVTLRQFRMIEIVRRVASHADFLHHSSGA